ncbi:MAG: peptide chain release factor N(5)-glutamine methyltransferase [Spirochaetes bacterium]|jgi:release factor glutamine methyltransferase|nr:peptide chain release factor N(5)-glutamine methyltransferase [Spirochaetota bacterium]
MMTVREAILEGTSRLTGGGAETPYLDATVLLAFCMGVTKEHLFAEFLSDVPAGALENYRDSIAKRERGIPVSYIRRQKEFYGRLFYVDERVLVPRPDTETAVEAALEIIDRRAAGERVEGARATGGRAGEDSPDGDPPRVLDCCTGSGAIAVTLAAERPGIEVAGSDLSAGAREVFLLNSRRILGAQLPFFSADILSGVPGTWDLIVANPPYLRSDKVAQMQTRGWPEPPNALDGGADGLELVRRLAGEALYSLKPYGYLVIEIGDEQGLAAPTIMQDAGYQAIGTREDLAGRSRVVIGRRG